MEIKVAVLTRYGSMGASSRLRMMQFDHALKTAGMSPTFHPLFDDSYLDRFYGGRRRLRPVIEAYARRLGHLHMARSADIIWLEKEALPWIPAVFEQGLLPRDIPVVSDYDDAIFHRYDMHRHALIRRLLGRKIDRIMAASSLVMAGNGYLADRARAAGARRVEVVPTVVDTDRYRLRPRPAPDAGPVIGWIGSPSTWHAYMAPLLPLLVDVAVRAGARLRIVGAGIATDLHPLIDALPWSEEEEVEQIRKMDIGIMPLDDSPWAQGKCGYKLIQYMACGLPVIATPVGVNSKIVEDGVSGILASNEDEWRAALLSLLNDAKLRKAMGAEGRRQVETHYSAQIWGLRIAGLLREAAERR